MPIIIAVLLLIILDIYLFVASLTHIAAEADITAAKIIREKYESEQNKS